VNIELAGIELRSRPEPLGDRFVGRVPPDSAANRDTPPFFERVVACPHSVVTAHLIDEPGQPDPGGSGRDAVILCPPACPTTVTQGTGG